MVILSQSMTQFQERNKNYSIYKVVRNKDTDNGSVFQINDSIRFLNLDKLDLNIFLVYWGLGHF